MSRDYKHVAKVKAHMADFAALFEAATKFAKGSDRWVEVQPRYMAFRFELRDAYLQFCKHVASRNLEMIEADRPHEAGRANFVAPKQQRPNVEQSVLGPQIEKALDEFQGACNRRMANANEANSPAEPLFHYTNERALTSIVESEEFRFTSIYHMDDTEELKFGFSVARSLLEEAAASKAGLIRSFCQDVLDAIPVEKLKQLIAFYSVSFGLRDDARQWKCYGDGGRGVALGLATAFFRPARLDPHHPKPEEEIFYGKVAYGDADARARHSIVFEAAFALIKQLQAAGCLGTAQDAELFCKHLNASMYTEVLWNCVTTKDSKWTHQNEMRLLALNSVKRPRLPIVMGIGDKPRVELPQPRLRSSIVEVMVGPQSDPGAFTRMREFLDSHGLTDVPVTQAARS
jgi:hypothetical protein